METNEVHVAIPPGRSKQACQRRSIQIITDDNSATIGYLEINIRNPLWMSSQSGKRGWVRNQPERNNNSISYYDLAKEATVPLPTGLQGCSDEVGLRHMGLHMIRVKPKN